MGMETKQPALDDRVAFSNPICEADRFGRVIAKRETRFGVDWEVQLDDGSIDTISRYTGTAEECDGYARILSGRGIGVYLVIK